MEQRCCGEQLDMCPRCPQVKPAHLHVHHCLHIQIRGEKKIFSRLFLFAAHKQQLVCLPLTVTHYIRLVSSQ